jgi:hypothetical protein
VRPGCFHLLLFFFGLWLALPPGAAAATPTVSLSTSLTFISEGSATNGFFSVTRTGDTSQALMVYYTVGGTARNGADYTRLPGAVTIPAGQSNALIVVHPMNDPDEEPAKTIDVRLSTNTAPFTLVLLPDTQYYVTGIYLEYFTRQIQWITNNNDSNNIVFVLHEGDCTDNNIPFEWDNFRGTMTGLDGVVPYALAVGNHDGLDTPGGDTTLFNAYFPLTTYLGSPTFGGVFEAGKLDNSFHRFTAGGVDWLVVSLEFGPRDAALDWANNVISNEPNRQVILLSHAHVYSDDTLHGTHPYHYWTPASYGRTNNGTEVWEKLVRRHANIRFFFNGHVLNDGVGRVIGTGDHGNTVYQMLANYQTYPNGGNSFLRLVRFEPDAEKFSVKS